MILTDLYFNAYGVLIWIIIEREILLEYLARSIIIASMYTFFSGIVWLLFGIGFKYSLFFFIPSLFVYMRVMALVAPTAISVKIEFPVYAFVCMIVWRVFLCHYSDDCIF